MPPVVIVTDVEHKSSLAAVRTLAAAGYEVVGVSGSTRSVGRWSRATRRSVRLPQPLEDEIAFIDGIAREIAKATTAIVLPSTDAALEVVSRHRDRLGPGALHGIPPHEIVMRCLSKSELEAAAVTVGFDVPLGRLCRTVDAVAEAVERLGPPVVIKPPRSEPGAGGRVPAVVVADVGEALAAARHALPTIVQACLEETALGAVSGVYADGRLLAHLVQKTILGHPRPNGGTSLYARTIVPEPGLLDRVVALLDRLGWEGMFELEFLTGSDDRRYVIDFNPRLWGALQLAVAAGIDPPVVWCDRLLGRPIMPRAASTGQGYRSEDAAAIQFVAGLRRRDVRHALRAVAPRPRTTHAYWSLSDPLPFIVRCGDSIPRRREN